MKRDRTTTRDTATLRRPLFIHQYSHAWIDYRGLRESRAPHVNYFVTPLLLRALIAVLHRLVARVPGILGEHVGHHCVRQHKVTSRGEDLQATRRSTDRCTECAGRVVDVHAGNSLAALKEMRRRYGERVYGR